MGLLTGILYACLAVYAAGWYFNRWSGNFSVLLFALTVVTFFYWVAERFWFAPRRRQAAMTLESAEAERRRKLAEQGIDKVDTRIDHARSELLMQPWWLDWTAGLFPVILVVFLLRSFLYEPFKIPSGSMLPTLVVGDLILVDKFHYGIRLPIINRKIVSLNDPKRGEVMVFRFPRDTTIDYIKRVVGIPGDEISFREQRVFLNGTAVPLSAMPPPGFYDEESRRYVPEYEEQFGERGHRILVNPQSVPFFGQTDAIRFPYRENCRYSAEGVTCKVPPGHYFMMGDNRDNSLDSRFWGFVPDENIVGRAFLIWMNFGNLGRVGSFR